MATLYWDIETRSTVDLRKAGVYVYAKDPTTEVLLAAWCIDDGPVVWARVDDPLIDDLKNALRYCDRVVAHNAGFERLLLTHTLAERDASWPVPPLHKWDCTAARAARCALPRSLDGAATALRLPVTKDKDGHALMMRMCKPRPARQGEDPDGVYWFEDDARMRRLGEYCAVDVDVERLLDKVLPAMTEDEQQVWILTEHMNDRGVPVDTNFVALAKQVAAQAEIDINVQMRKATSGLVSSVSNLSDLREWLRAKFGLLVLAEGDNELTKRSIEKLLERADLPEEARRALQLRLDGGKASVKKLEAMALRTDADSRARGNLVYHGASTGRFAGSGIQLQNLPRKVIKDFDGALADMARGGLDKYGTPLSVLSQMLRGAIRAEFGNELIWCDYAAVEARGVAWLAGQHDLVELFASGGKVYEEMAAQIFQTKPENIKSDSTERFVGKTVILGCGYGMGAKKFRQTCELQGVSIDDDLAKRAVDTYRSTNPLIPALWRGLEEAAVAAVDTNKKTTRYGAVAFKREDDWLKMRLPSGRVLYFAEPSVESVVGPYGQRAALSYMAVNSLTKKWNRETTWGGKLAENAVQALCRDLMTHALLNLDLEGFNPILSVHDEIICELPIGVASESDVIAVMCRLPDWAAGFPLKAEGKKGIRYGK